MDVRLAAICPCVLLAGIVTAAGMPKSWQLAPVPLAAVTPAGQKMQVQDLERRLAPIAARMEADGTQFVSAFSKAAAANENQAASMKKKDLTR